MASSGSPPRAVSASASVPSTPVASTSTSFGASSMTSTNAPFQASTPLNSANTSMDSMSSGLMTPTPSTSLQLNGAGPVEGPTTSSGNYTVRKTARAGLGIAPGNYTSQSPSVASTATTASGATASSAQPSTAINSNATASAMPPAWPALHLTPLNDTFVPKQISLFPPGTKVKIGRQTNAKTVPNNSNGYFDSKVLSRMHAEVWSDEGKVFIKDVKSSNGTFINGNRLSPEATESEVFELHSDDQVEFGIDIVSDDSKTIVHHKVSARVFLVLNENDLAVSQRDFNRWYREAGENPMARRGAKVVQSSTANGLSFEHVFNRLQGELQKSRDTGASLGDVSTTLGDVHDTLGGGIPPPLPPFSRIPPYAGPQTTQPTSQSRDPHAQTIAQIQSQLSDTQSALSSHVAKIRDLEGMLKEHEALKRDVGALRMQMDEAKKDMDFITRAREREGRESPVARLLEADDVDLGAGAGASSRGDIGSRERALTDENSQLNARLEQLSASLAKATADSESLKEQHSAASSTIAALEAKVSSLESAMKEQVDLVAWKDAFERDWNRDRQAWHAERQMLLDRVREWEQRAVPSTSATRASPSRTQLRRRRRKSSPTNSERGASSQEDDEDDEDDTRTLSTAITSPSSSSSSHRSQGGRSSTTSTRGPTNSNNNKLDWRRGNHSASAGPGGGRYGHGGLTWRSDGGQPPLGQYAGAGAIVVIGVAAAWLMSAKIKD